MILTIFSDRSTTSYFLQGPIYGILKRLYTVIISVHLRKHTVGKEIKNVRRGRGPCPELAGVFQVLIRKYRDQLETVSRNIISTSANFRRESTFADLTLVVEGAQVGMTKNTLL